MADFTDKIEPFVLLARSTKGAAAAKVIQDATSAPGVFVFAELMDVPNIQELASVAEHQKSYELLRLFAYGTLETHATGTDAYPPLSSSQVSKLRLLTLLSLALQQRALPYDLLLEKLQVTSIRHLEDTIIEGIYAGLLTGKMHHHEKVLYVDWCTGRDVSPEQLEVVKQKMANWCMNTASLLVALDERIATETEQARRADEEAQQYTIERDRLYQQLAQEAKLRPSEDPSGSGFKSGSRGGFLRGGAGSGQWPRGGGRKTVGGKSPRSGMIKTRDPAHDAWIAAAGPGGEGARQYGWGDEAETGGSIQSPSVRSRQTTDNMEAERTNKRSRT